MKVYIHTDIEGIAGWVFYGSYQNSIFNYQHLQRMNRLLTAEVNAAVRASFESGASEVYVNDSHGYAYSIIFEDLDPRCRIIHGRSGYFPAWLPLLDESFSAVIGIGMHARAGSAPAVCPHSCWHLYDGQGKYFALSECGMCAALAAEKGVPLVMISGDDAIAREITGYIPGCETAIVKQAFANQNACSMIPAAACELIAEKVKAGLKKIDTIKPFKLQSPYRLNVSDRDPEHKELPQDAVGHDLWSLMHDTCRCFGNRWGDQAIDDRSWRFPDNVFKSAGV